MDLNKKWLMNERTTIKQREILFLIMDALEIPIYKATRNHEDYEEYPYLRLVGSYRIDNSKARTPLSGEQLVTYEELFTALRNELSIKSKEAWIQE